MSVQRNKTWICLLFCLLVMGRIPAGSLAQDPDFSLDLLESYEIQRRATAEMMEKATLWVIADGRRSIASGSGFVVADGYVVTNAHVVNDENNMTYYLMNEYLPLTRATLIDKVYDRRSENGNDFALLKFDIPEGVALPVLSFNLDVRRMDRVSAWGYPDMITHFDSSVRNMRTNINNIRSAPPVVYTEGTVSTLIRHRGLSIIHTASIAAGNSGGPLVNHRGEVVGINTWGYIEEGEGAFVNGSLPASELVAFLRKNGIEPRLAQAGNTAIAYGPDQDQPTAGQTDQAIAARQDLEPAGPEPDRGLPLWLQVAQYTGYADFNVFYPEIAAPASQPGRSGPEPEQNLVPTGTDDARITEAGARTSLNAALEGDLGQMIEAGLGYMDGSKGFPLDKGAAFTWLNQAAGLGSYAAQGLAGMYYLLDADMRNSQLGMDYLRQSVSGPDPDPRFMDFLAMVLYQGEYLGVAPDAQESLLWAQKAAEAGNASSQALLGFHYLDGKAVDQDRAKALEYALASAQAGSGMGKSLLAHLRFLEPEFQSDPQAVIDLAEEAAAAGEPTAQGLLARIYAFDERCLDLAKAERYARLAAGRANVLGQYVLGWLYLNGKVVEQNIPMAWAYLQYTHNRLEDLGVDPDGPLLIRLERGISQRQRLRGQQIQNSWRVAWGFAR